MITNILLIILIILFVRVQKKINKIKKEIDILPHVTEQEETK
jgi:hypothetical protein